MTLLNKHLAKVAKVSYLGANIACVMDLINPRSPADAVWSRFFGAIGIHETNVCGLFVLGDVMFVDEKTTICLSQWACQS